MNVLALAPGVFPNLMEAELHVFSGKDGAPRLPLVHGRVMPVWRDEVEAICGWEEK